MRGKKSDNGVAEMQFLLLLGVNNSFLRCVVLPHGACQPRKQGALGVWGNPSWSSQKHTPSKQKAKRERSNFAHAHGSWVFESPEC